MPQPWDISPMLRTTRKSSQPPLSPSSGWIAVVNEFRSTRMSFHR
jgi:hypothetical protein